MLLHDVTDHMPVVPLLPQRCVGIQAGQHLVITRWVELTIDQRGQMLFHDCVPSKRLSEPGIKLPTTNAGLCRPSREAAAV